MSNMQKINKSLYNRNNLKYIGQYFYIFKRMYKKYNYDKLESINHFNTNNLTCYKCWGFDLIGWKCNSSYGHSCIVWNNEYEVYEAPHYANRGLSCNGKLLVLLKNTTQKYLLIGYLVHRIYKKNNEVKYYTSFYCIGQFKAIIKKLSDITIRCTHGIRDLDYGTTEVVHSEFDHSDLRKNAYRCPRTKINKYFGIH